MRSRTAGDFNSEMLLILREASGLTQAETAALTKISQSKLSKLENGLQPPSEAQLEALADLLQVEVEVLFRSERLMSMPTSLYRKRASTSRRQLKQLEGELNLLRMDLERLFRPIDLQAPLPLEPQSVNYEVGRTPSEIARELRMLWQIPRGPVPNLVEQVEAAGIVVLLVEFLPDKVDGVTVRNPPGGPDFVCLNPVYPWDRLRWTLAHELGHLIMHQSDVSEEAEDEADEFASEFLMPADQIRGHFQALSINSLMQLKPRWRVSMQSLLRRATDIGAIKKPHATRLWRSISSRGWRKSEPVALAPETPTLVRDIVALHLEQLAYTEEQLARSLGFGEAHLRRRLGFALPSREQKRFVVIPGGRTE